MDKPVLSIGIIFKNDIRCIERCLKALQPLRDAIPSELVMADTGSEDGSREVAEKYADILIDFPWVNDFAAARNAVMERCSGKWHMAVDTDEYLDGGVDELVHALESDQGVTNMYRVVIRSYANYELEGNYSDFLALRMVRMSTGMRYQGAIHEHLAGTNKSPIISLPTMVFKHDGYVNMGGESGKAKRERNLTLLREEMKSRPEDLIIRLQMIESSAGEPDYLSQIRKGIAMVRKRTAGWQIFGPPIFRHAVNAAGSMHLTEFWKWAKLALDWFPNSYFVRIDVAYQAMMRGWLEKSYEKGIRWGEILKAGYEDFRAGLGDVDCQSISPLHAATPYSEQTMRIILACAYLETNRAEESLPLLLGLDYGSLDLKQVESLAKTLRELHSKTHVDTSGLISSVWKGLCEPVPSQKQADMRRNVFLLVGASVFSSNHLKKERSGVSRPAYTLFLPLAGECPLGIAAAMLKSHDPAELTELLGTVEKWEEFPASAVAHAMENGAAFPLAGRPLRIEEMDTLAFQLSGEWDRLFALLQRTAETNFAENWQTLAWTWDMALAAVRACQWEDEEKGMALARTFAAAEHEILSRCYVPELLTEENLFFLQPTHRFGWYCIQAFAALDSGDAVGYVRLLRKGLDTAKDMKPMVEFLTEHTPSCKRPSPQANCWSWRRRCGPC
ncbi:MAG: glycosyltransferase, partial [Oscillospiraceae bacterium]|nr:glycosyltransferase [Oscillospiraceae bacterium]